MTTSSAHQSVRFQLQDLCRRLEVSPRDARYLCERSWLPEGVDREPGRGNHRQLSARQAVWLGVVLKLKGAGIKTPLAARIGAFVENIRSVTRNLGWDWTFAPFDGAFDTDHQWYMEVADTRFIRFVTDANPSKAGLGELPWIDMETRQHAPDRLPIVCIRVDVSALARLLRGCPQAGDPVSPNHEAAQAGPARACET
jgi:hypothetical protein